MDNDRLPYLAKIDLTKRILEIGPLTDPIIIKSNEAPFVYYADIRSTEEVKAFYKNNATVPQNQIVDIDFVIEKSYAETFNNEEPFDYIIMHHVIEHVPQLIRFFLDVSTALNDGGKLILTIPDARYSFDHNRVPTTFAELYDIYKRGDEVPAARTLDALLNVDVSSNPDNKPDIMTDYMHVPNGLGTVNEAIQAYEAATQGEQFDVHYGVFSPATFLLNIYYLTEAGLFPYELTEFYTQEGFSIEFHAVLTKYESIRTDKEHLQILLETIKKRMAETGETQSDIFDPQRYNALQDQVFYQAGEIKLMANSLSWKITGFIRKLSKLIR